METIDGDEIDGFIRLDGGGGGHLFRMCKLVGEIVEVVLIVEGYLLDKQLVHLPEIYVSSSFHYN